MEFSLLKILSILSLKIHVICSGEFYRFALRRLDMQIKNVSIWKESTESSVMCCAAKCSMYRCLTVSFNSDEMRCQLSYKDVTHKTIARHFTQKAGWISFSRIVYTVYNRRSNSGSYTITWKNAEPTCKSENTTLASEADLMQSRALGLNECTCGWLSNGKSGFVMQFIDPDCWRKFSEKVIYCPWELSNVWCRV